MNKSIRFAISVFVVLIITINIVKGAGLIGNYTINSALPTGGTNFISFNSLADSINLNGVSGNVIITVAPGSGPYNEQVVFKDIPGASDTSTVTLDGSGETISAITDSTNRHIVRLWDIQYFTITNLHIAWNPASTRGFYGIHIFNTGNHINITNCSVDLSGTTSTLYGAYVASGSETSILTTGDFHNITISHDTATGGGYGVSVFGLISNLASNIVISDNVFYDFHSNGVYLRETNGAVISGNYFDKRTSNITSVNAILIAQAANINANIFNNFIKVSQTLNGTMPFYGIYLFNGTGHKVYNNVIYDVNLVSGDFTGIVVRTGGTAPEIYFNTISIDNPNAGTGDLIGIEEELSNTNSVLRNNLISISQPTTGMKAGLAIGAIASVTTAFNSNNNLIWVPNGNAAIVNSLTPTLYPSLNDWQNASGQDSVSFSVDPGFISLSQPIPTSLAADNGGITIPFITTDVLGAIRSNTPDIGAYEYLPEGINQLKIENLNSYPNPVNSKLNLVLPEINYKNSSISIFNSCGKLINKKEITLSSGEKEISIGTENLSPGLYLMMFVSGKKAYLTRFVKE